MTQEERLLDYLTENKTVTGIEALNALGIFRLASRIYNLKKQGHIISSKIITIKNRFSESCHVSEYTLVMKNDSK